MLADYCLEIIDKKGSMFLWLNDTPNQTGFESYFKNYNDMRFDIDF